MMTRRPSTREKATMAELFAPLERSGRWCPRCETWVSGRRCGWCGAVTLREPLDPEAAP